MLKPIGKRIRNIARKPPIDANHARIIADTLIWARQFNADYDQVLLRVSDVPNGLRSGSRPPTVQ